ncbi:hypothetical protein MYSI104531_26415 [Mycobacterium simiae]
MSPPDLGALLGRRPARVADRQRSRHRRRRWSRGPLRRLGLVWTVVTDHWDDGVDLTEDEFTILLAAQRFIGLVLLAAGPALPPATATRRCAPRRSAGAQRTTGTRRRAREFGSLSRGRHRRTGRRQRVAPMRSDAGATASFMAGTRARPAERIEVLPAGQASTGQASTGHAALVPPRPQRLLQWFLEPLRRLAQPAAQPRSAGTSRTTGAGEATRWIGRGTEGVTGTAERVSNPGAGGRNEIAGTCARICAAAKRIGTADVVQRRIIARSIESAGKCGGIRRRRVRQGEVSGAPRRITRGIDNSAITGRAKTIRARRCRGV